MKLFEFQEESVSMIKKSLARNKRSILNLVTGGGKTVIGSHIVSEVLNKGNKVTVLVHRVEILHQFFSTLVKFGITPELITAGKKTRPGAQVYLGMVETFKRRSKNPGFAQSFKDHLLICDEVHWGSYQSIVDNFEGFVIGLTATPKAASGKELNEYFADCVCPIGVKELISIGRLVNGKTYSIEYDFSNLKLQGKDFSSKELIQEFKKPKLFTGALEEYERNAKGRKAIVYSVNVEQSIATANMFQEAGYRSFHVDATSEDRDMIFRDFGRSDDGILFNVGIATTGYDEPSVTCIIENFATAQVTKHHQVIGRGARCCEGKDDFIIIDMGRNYLRHGMYGEDIPWVSIFNNPKLGKSKKEESQIKNIECPNCGAIISMTLHSCPYCDEMITAREKEEVILDKGTTKEIKEYKLKTIPPNLRGIRPINMTFFQLKEYAAHMDYSPGWVGMQMGLKKKYGK